MNKNKSIEELKKELEAMHKAFDSILSDNKKSENIQQEVKSDENTTIDIKLNKNVNIKKEENKEFVESSSNGFNEEKINTPLKEETISIDKEIQITFEKEEKIVPVRSISKKNDQYLSIREKLEKIKAEIKKKNSK